MPPQMLSRQHRRHPRTTAALVSRTLPSRVRSGPAGNRDPAMASLESRGPILLRRVASARSKKSPRRGSCGPVRAVE